MGKLLGEVYKFEKNVGFDPQEFFTWPKYGQHVLHGKWPERETQQSVMHTADAQGESLLFLDCAGEVEQQLF